MTTDSEQGEGPASAERLAAARQRLDAMLGGLESAINRQMASGGPDKLAERQIQHLTVDRGKLAEEIDDLKRQNRQLLEANSDALSRLDRAIEAVQALMRDDEA